MVLVSVRRQRPLAAPRPAFLAREHIPHLGLDLGPLDVRVHGPARGDKVPKHAALPLHVHGGQRNVGAHPAVPDEPPLVADHEVLLQRHVQKPIVVPVVFLLPEFAVGHDHGGPPS